MKTEAPETVKPERVEAPAVKVVSVVAPVTPRVPVKMEFPVMAKVTPFKVVALTVAAVRRFPERLVAEK